MASIEVKRNSRWFSFSGVNFVSDTDIPQRSVSFSLLSRFGKWFTSESKTFGSWRIPNMIFPWQIVGLGSKNNTQTCVIQKLRMRSICRCSCTANLRTTQCQRLMLYSATKGVKRKDVYYVFLYKQQLDNVYTPTTIHRFTLSPLHPGAHGCWASTPSALLLFS